MERGGEPPGRAGRSCTRCCRTSTCSSSTTARPTARPTRRAPGAPRCSRSGRTAGLPAGIAAGYGWAAEHGYRFCGRVDADGQHPPPELRKLLDLVRSDACDVAVGSRFVSGEGYPEYRYEASGARKFGHFVLRRAMQWRLGGPMMDATSGMYAVNQKAMPILAEPYNAGAPEVEGLTRLAAAGLRIAEVPVDMRERASGESKLQGKKAVMLVLTVAGVLLLGAERLRRRR